MSAIILPGRRTSQPPDARASNLALSLGCGTLLLPTDTGWTDALNLLSPTGAVGSPAAAVTPTGVARSYSASADFFQDGGILDPSGGYAWLMHCTLTSSGGNWGGLISRTRDNATTAGWGWQKDNSGNIAVYHGSTNRYSFGSVTPLIDGQAHTLLGLWRSNTNEIELWRDGALFWSGSLTTTPDFWAGQGQIKLFSSRDTATFAGTASLAAVFSGLMDQGAASELSANPWQLFSAKRTLYFDTTAGTGGTTQNLAGTATGTAIANATLTLAVPLSGAGVAIATATGAISHSVPVAGDATATANAAGNLSLVVPLLASAVAQALASANLSIGVPLAGTTGGQASASGNLALSIGLSGMASAQANAAAGLNVITSGLSGVAAAVATASGALTHAVPLTAAATAVAVASGTIAHGVPLSGTATAVAYASAGITHGVPLAGSALATATFLGLLDVVPSSGVVLAGNAVAGASSTGALSLLVSLGGIASARASATSTLITGSTAPIRAGTPGFIVFNTPRAFIVTSAPRSWRVTS